MDFFTAPCKETEVRFFYDDNFVCAENICNRCIKRKRCKIVDTIGCIIVDYDMAVVDATTFCSRFSIR